MRKTTKVALLLSSTFLLPVFSAQAAKISLPDVPEHVIKAFEAEHPEAKNIQVNKNRHFDLTLYEIKFKGNDGHHETLMTSEGKHFGHEISVDINKLPQAIPNKLAQIFKKFSISDAEKISHPDGRIEYEIDVLSDSGKWELAMNLDGDVLVKEKD